MPRGVDSTLPGVASVDTSTTKADLPLALAPPLAWMAALAASAELLINRVLLRSWEASWSREALVRFDRWGDFARNVAVMSGLVAFTFCIAAFCSRRSRLPLSARLGLAGFGGAFIPAIALMTAMPRTWTGVELVLVVAGLAHGLMFLLILVGLRWRSSRPTIAALLMLLITTTCSIASLIVALLGGRGYWEHTERLANAFRWSGEIAYLLVPIAVGLALRIAARAVRGQLVVAMSTLAAAAVAGGLVAWRSAVGRAEFATVIYGSFRLNLLPDRMVLLYAIPLGIGWAVACAASLAREPERRQLGAGLFVLLSAGYAPRTPSALVFTVLAVALVARSAVAEAQKASTRSA